MISRVAAAARIRPPVHTVAREMGSAFADARLLDKPLQIVAHQPEEQKASRFCPCPVDGRFAVADVHFHGNSSDSTHIQKPSTRNVPWLMGRDMAASAEERQPLLARVPASSAAYIPASAKAGGSGPCAADDKEALSAKTGERSFVKGIHGQEGTGKRFPSAAPERDGHRYGGFHGPYRQSPRSYGRSYAPPRRLPGKRRVGRGLEWTNIAKVGTSGK